MADYEDVLFPQTKAYIKRLKICTTFIKELFQYGLNKNKGLFETIQKALIQGILIFREQKTVEFLPTKTKEKY